MRLPGLLLAGFLIAAPPAEAQIKLLEGRKVLPAEITARVESLMQEFKVVGAQLAILTDGKLVYNRSLGYADIKSRKPVDDATLFQAASITKPVFAYTVLRLVDQGVLALDTPLYRYYPHPDAIYEPRYRRITTRQVLSHSTGLPNWRCDDTWNDLAFVQNPDDGFQYSGEAYLYLSTVVAHLTRGRVDSLMQKQTFDPLGMHHACLTWNPYLAAHGATGYQDSTALPVWKSVVPNTAGGLRVSALDMVPFLQAIMNEKGLSAASWAQMLTPRSKAPDFLQTKGEEGFWGLGIAIGSAPGAVRYWHGGNNPGFEAYFEVYKGQKFGYILLTNCQKGDEMNARLKTYLHTGQ